MQPATRCVHIQSPAESPTGDHKQSGGSVMPIDPSTAYEFIDQGDQPYPRYFNTPNQLAVARTVADLEFAEDGLVFASGMAAISTTLMALLNPGDHAIFLRGLYGGSHALVAGELEKRGVEFSWTDGTVDSIASLIRATTRVVYIESPTNPCLNLVDLAAISNCCRDRSAGREQRITTVIDNTFASPINQNPLRLGIDIAIHSGTKYLGGHSDLCCGAAVGNTETIQRVRQQALHYGGSLNALTAYLLDRSLKTLSVRVEKQTQNAFRLATWLDQHQAISRVHYPGLAHHPQHELAKKQMLGFGAMMAIEPIEAASISSLLKSLRVIRPALSLGGVESSMCVPALTSHRHVPAEELNDMGVTPNLIRFSVGIEDLDDLQTDLNQALDCMVSVEPVEVPS